MDKEKYSIIFSSLTGNTKKLADTIRAVLPAEDCDYFGAPKAEQEKGIGAFPHLCRSRQPAVRAATGVCGILEMALIIGLQICFDAILCKNAHQSRVCKTFGTRRHTRKEVWLDG
mgnify:CR=1 FL=1